MFWHHKIVCSGNITGPGTELRKNGKEDDYAEVDEAGNLWKILLFVLVLQSKCEC